MNSYPFSDPRIREVVVTEGIGQIIECPSQSRITILFSKDFIGEQINNCENDFYEFYVSRRFVRFLWGRFVPSRSLSFLLAR